MFTNPTNNQLTYLPTYPPTYLPIAQEEIERIKAEEEEAIIEAGELLVSSEIPGYQEGQHAVTYRSSRTQVPTSPFYYCSLA